MICEHCGKEYIQKKKIKGQKYCSSKCAQAASTKRRKPLSHVVIYRAVIVDYLGNKCAKCGTAKNLNIHHIKPRFLGGEDKMENLTLLCRKHHRELHSELYKKY